MKLQIKIAKLFLFLALTLAFANVGFSEEKNDYTLYEYLSKINIECEEYIGYARAELPSEFVSLKNPKAYMDVNYYIEKSQKSYYKGEYDWYIKTIDDYPVEEVEKIYDNNFYTYFIADDKSSLIFEIENPSMVETKKIAIDIKDSSIDAINIYDINNNIINFELKQSKFHYELILNNEIITDKIRFEIFFDDIIKIRNINFYSEEESGSQNYIYFYVDNMCNKTYNFYFGNYGKSNLKSGSQKLPVEFETSVETFKNSLYTNDFDNDSIINNDDNCLFVPNKDQKDINYNKVGDACEDTDGDSIENLYDNCPDKKNFNQNDVDADGLGDACDETDDRFFEKNKYLIYILAAIIAITFIFLSYLMIKKK